MFNRRQFLKHCEAVAVAAGVASTARWSFAAAGSPALSIGFEPQLLLDDYLIDTMNGLNRVMRPPSRLASPVLDNKTFGTTQPFMSVIRDGVSPRYRIWYNNGAAVWHAESEDGIQWHNPRMVWQTTHCFGASVIDDGPSADPERRFKIANWQATRIREDRPGDDGGMWVGFSPDGLRWTGYAKNPVLPTWPEGFGKVVPYAAQDIVDVFYDPRRRNYAVALKTPAVAADGFGQGPRAGGSIRRLVGMSTSTDFVHWEKPWRIITPNDREEGLVEFYGMGGVHLRGGLYIGFVRVLHDDLPCDDGGPRNGIGYAALATSRDGRTWHRFREPFLDRNPVPGSWDHAMTWIGSALPVESELFLYYGGYARGHKIEPQHERQIGLARMKRDRYAALETTHESGRLVTRPLICPGGRLTINADAREGEIHMRLLNADGQPIEPSTAIRQVAKRDELAADIRLEKQLESRRGQPVRLEFSLQHASLYGFQFHNTNSAK